MQKSTRKSSAKNAKKSSEAISNTAKEAPDDETTGQKAIRVDIDGRMSKGRVSPPFVENTSSLDARLEFKRQMEVLMEATKVPMLVKKSSMLIKSCFDLQL